MEDPNKKWMVGCLPSPRLHGRKPSCLSCPFLKVSRFAATQIIDRSRIYKQDQTGDTGIINDTGRLFMMKVVDVCLILFGDTHDQLWFNPR